MGWKKNGEGSLRGETYSAKRRRKKNMQVSPSLSVSLRTLPQTAQMSERREVAAKQLHVGDVADIALAWQDTPSLFSVPPTLDAFLHFFFHSKVWR